jgi:hypothetical protein
MVPVITDLFRESSNAPVSKELPFTLVMAPTVGRPYIVSMRPDSFGSPSKKGEAGAKYHGVDETGIPFRDIASKIAAKLQVPTSSCPTPKSAKHLGILSNFVGLDSPSSSEWTRQTLGWKPTQPGLLTDIDQPDYCKI